MDNATVSGLNQPGDMGFIAAERVPHFRCIGIPIVDTREFGLSAAGGRVQEFFDNKLRRGGLAHQLKKTRPARKACSFSERAWITSRHLPMSRSVISFIRWSGSFGRKCLRIERFIFFIELCRLSRSFSAMKRGSASAKVIRKLADDFELAFLSAHHNPDFASRIDTNAKAGCGCVPYLDLRSALRRQRSNGKLRQVHSHL